MEQNKFSDLKRQTKNLINLNPIQTGGKLTEPAKKILNEFGDGYAVYDISPGLEIQDVPIVKEFVCQILPKFLGSDIAKITLGAREGIFNVMHSLTKPNDTIIVDSNRHYTTITAAERCGLKIIEVANSGEPKFKINVLDYENLIKKHNPKLILLTYPDGNYGNLPDAKKLGTISKKYNIPYLLNASYLVGRMPIKINEIGADFIIGSGHKSLCSSGPIGVLGMKKKWEKILLRKSKIYPSAEIEFLGAELRGASILTLMASFSEVKRRVENWDEEVKKAQWFAKEFEKMGFVLFGQKPHRHDLMFFKTDILYEISKNHKKKGYFLYSELKKRGIVGIKPGHTKAFKLSTYGISREKLKIVLDAFADIIGQNQNNAFK